MGRIKRLLLATLAAAGLVAHNTHKEPDHVLRIGYSTDESAASKELAQGAERISHVRELALKYKDLNPTIMHKFARESADSAASVLRTAKSRPISQQDETFLREVIADLQTISNTIEPHADRRESSQMIRDLGQIQKTRADLIHLVERHVKIRFDHPTS